MDSQLMELAWRDFIYWAFGQPDMRFLFEQASGMAPLGQAALDVLVDDATGYRGEYLEAFTLWATETHWGMEHAPKAFRNTHQMKEGGSDG